METNFIMQEKVSRVSYLIEKFIEEDMTVEEDTELNAWVAETEHNRSFFQQITNKEILKEKLKIYSSANSDEIWKKTLNKINASKIINFKNTKTLKIFPIVAFTRWLASFCRTNSWR